MAHIQEELEVTLAQWHDEMVRMFREKTFDSPVAWDTVVTVAITVSSLFQRWLKKYYPSTLIPPPDPLLELSQMASSLRFSLVQHLTPLNCPAFLHQSTITHWLQHLPFFSYNLLLFTTHSHVQLIQHAHSHLPKSDTETLALISQARQMAPHIPTTPFHITLRAAHACVQHDMQVAQPLLVNITQSLMDSDEGEHNLMDWMHMICQEDVIALQWIVDLVTWLPTQMLAPWVRVWMRMVHWYCESWKSIISSENRNISVYHVHHTLEQAIESILAFCDRLQQLWQCLPQETSDPPNRLIEVLSSHQRWHDWRAYFAIQDLEGSVLQYATCRLLFILDYRNHGIEKQIHGK